MDALYFLRHSLRQAVEAYDENTPIVDRLNDFLEANEGRITYGSPNQQPGVQGPQLNPFGGIRFQGTCTRPTGALYFDVASAVSIGVGSRTDLCEAVEAVRPPAGAAFEGPEPFFRLRDNQRQRLNRVDNALMLLERAAAAVSMRASTR